MKVFNCILGILTVLASIYCIFYPGLTFLNVGWIVTIILGLWGISSIVSYAASRNDGNNKEKSFNGNFRSYSRHSCGGCVCARNVYARHKSDV